MPKTVIFLSHDVARKNAHIAIDSAPDGYMMILAEKTRTLEQNSLLWALLTDVSRQVEWYGCWLTPEDWKHIFSAALHKQDVVPNLDGSGFVILGQSTSKMTKKEFSDLVELIMAFGTERGVKWTNEQSTDGLQTKNLQGSDACCVESKQGRLCHQNCIMSLRAQDCVVIG